MIPRNEVRIEISTACNAECTFCPHPTDKFTRPKKIMSTEDFKKYLSKVIEEGGEDITDIGLSGFGELFMDNKVLEKIGYANSFKRDIHILTNSSLLDKSIMDELFLFENIKDIRISIHTEDREKYNSTMKFKGERDYYDKVRENIDYLIDNKPSTMDLILTAVIDDSLKDEVDDLISAYKDRCVLEVWQPHNWVYGKDYRDIGSSAKRKRTCGRPSRGPIEVLVNGDVIMCCFDFNSEMVIGNLSRDSLEDIYSSPLFDDISNHHKKGTCNNSGLTCRGCDQLENSSDILIFSNKFSEGTERVNVTSTSSHTLNKQEKI